LRRLTIYLDGDSVKRREHDRILDLSTAVSGSTYFLPSNDLLEGLGG